VVAYDAALVPKVFTNISWIAAAWALTAWYSCACAANCAAVSADILQARSRWPSGHGHSFCQAAVCGPVVFITCPICLVAQESGPLSGPEDAGLEWSSGTFDKSKGQAARFYMATSSAEEPCPRAVLAAQLALVHPFEPSVGEVRAGADRRAAAAAPQTCGAGAQLHAAAASSRAAGGGGMLSGSGSGAR
jgi:hypothetical protein